MATDNLGAVICDKGDLRVEKVPMPGEPGDHEVLLRMSQVGICGSDVYYFAKGAIGDFIVKEPMLLGHDAAGVVIKCGSKVNNLKQGDRVAIEPGVPCYMCDYCKGGAYNLCLDVIYCATPSVHGNLCRYYKHAADFCFKLPDNLSLEEGAILGPLSCGIQACQRAHVTHGSTVLICGAGPIGLMSLLTAKYMGATNICVTDVVEKRLKVAKNIGANHILLVDSKDSEALALTDKITNLMGCMPDITIDCSGSVSSIQLGISATKYGGMMVLVGMGPAEVKIPRAITSEKEVDIRIIFRYMNCYHLALEMIVSGRVDVKPLITHRYKLEETIKAFDTARTGAGGAIQVMISCE